MNPMVVAQARTARLVREAQTPVFSTATKPVVREHMKMVEIEADTGYRFWSKPLRETKVDAYIAEHEAIGYGLSDIDCSAKCWCQ